MDSALLGRIGAGVAVPVVLPDAGLLRALRETGADALDFAGTARRTGAFLLREMIDDPRDDECRG